jgi:hypothetical protein
MDGITFDQLQSVFGDVESELKQTSSLLENIQGFLNQKLKSFDEPLDKLDQITSYLKQLKEPIDVKEIDKQKVVNTETKQDKDNTAKKGNSIFDIEATTASKVISASAKVLPVRVVDDPKQHTQVDILIPPVTRVFIENLLGDNIKRLTEFGTHETDRLIKAFKGKADDKKDDKKSWIDKLIAGLLGAGLVGKLLSGIMKPFTWLAGNLLKLLPTVLKDIGKLILPIVRGLLGAVGPLLAGAGLAIAGIATLLSGLKDSGPYKGLKKLLGKGLLDIGANLIKKEFGKLGKLVSQAVGSLTKGGSLRNFIAVAKKGINGIFRTIGKLPGKLFGGIAKAITGLFTGGALKEGSEVAAKGAGKGGFKAILGNIGKFLSEKVLKRLPFIGTLIGLGFAFTRLMKGDVIGALLDVASALATSVPVVGTALSIAIDVFSAVRDTKTGGSEKAGAGNMGWVNGIKKWIGERIKYVPVIGPLIDMAKAFGDGNYLDALGYLAKAAIPPLGIIIDLFDNTEAISNAAVSAGNWIADTGAWLYSKAKDMPIIGSLIKAGEAIAGGKWGDVLGYLGEAIEPLQYIGKLIESGAENVAQAVTTGDFSSIKTFFTTIKDSLIKAVLNLLPDEIFGISVRSRVAKMLGIAGYGDVKDGDSVTQGTSGQPSPTTSNKAPKKEESHWWNRFSKKTNETPNTDTANTPQATTPDNNTTQPSTSNVAPATPQPSINASETSAPTLPLAVNIQPNDQPFVPDTSDDDKDDAADNMSDSLSEHSNLLKGLIEYQKQTASNTKELIQAFMKNQSNNNNVNVNNVNSSTNIISSPVTSSMFRQAVLQR